MSDRNTDVFFKFEDDSFRKEKVSCFKINHFKSPKATVVDDAIDWIDRKTFPGWVSGVNDIT